MVSSFPCLTLNSINHRPDSSGSYLTANSFPGQYNRTPKIMPNGMNGMGFSSLSYFSGAKLSGLPYMNKEPIIIAPQWESAVPPFLLWVYCPTMFLIRSSVRVIAFLQVWIRGNQSNMKYHFQNLSTIFTISRFVEISHNLYFTFI